MCHVAARTGLAAVSEALNEYLRLPGGATYRLAVVSREQGRPAERLVLLQIGEQVPVVMSCALARCAVQFCLDDAALPAPLRKAYGESLSMLGRELLEVIGMAEAMAHPERLH